MLDKLILTNIMIILGLFLLFINPALSYILILLYYFFLNNKNWIMIFLLLLNIGIIAIFKLPNSDHYRYYRFFEDIGILTKEEFYNFLIGQKDYIFHIYMYLCSKYLNYKFWISGLTIATFLFLILSLKDQKKFLGKKLIIFFFDPFNIKRWTLGIALYIFGEKYTKKYKILGILTHLSILILPISKIFSKFIPNKIIYKKKVVVLIFMFIIGIIFSRMFSLFLKQVGVHEIYLNWRIDSMLIEGNLKARIVNVYTVYLDYAIFFFIFFSKKNAIDLSERKIEMLITFILINSLCINLVMSRRLLQIFIIFYVYNYFEKIDKRQIKKIILIMLLSKYFLLFVVNIKYGYKVKSYPILSNVTKEKIMLNNKNEPYKNIYKKWKGKK